MALKQCGRCKSRGGDFASCIVCKKNGCECCVKDNVCIRCKKADQQGPGFRCGGVIFKIGQQAEGSPWGSHVTFYWEKPRTHPILKQPPRRDNFLDAFKKMGTR